MRVKIIWKMEATTHIPTVVLTLQGLKPLECGEEMGDSSVTETKGNSEENRDMLEYCTSTLHIMTPWISMTYQILAGHGEITL